jgi:hypothetical protein
VAAGGAGLALLGKAALIVGEKVSIRWSDESDEAREGTLRALDMGEVDARSSCSDDRTVIDAVFGRDALGSTPSAEGEAVTEGGASSASERLGWLMAVLSLDRLAAVTDEEEEAGCDGFDIPRSDKNRDLLAVLPLGLPPPSSRERSPTAGAPLAPRSEVSVSLRVQTGSTDSNNGVLRADPAAVLSASSDMATESASASCG